jgi:hypothetical protein
MIADKLGQARDAQLDHVLLVALFIAHNKVGVITQQLAQVGLACGTGAAHKQAPSTATRWVQQDVAALPEPLKPVVSDMAHYKLGSAGILPLANCRDVCLSVPRADVFGCLRGHCCVPCCVYCCVPN